MTNIAGIDPGLKGGIAIMNLETGKPIAAYAMPVKGKRKKTINLGAIQTILITHNVKVGIVESAFRAGVENAAKTEAVLELCNIPVVTYKPQTWQQLLEKQAGDNTKDRAYAYCLAHGYSVSISSNCVYHDGIADAWCIAAYHVHKIHSGD
jgi:hypothetical protein